MVRRSRLIEFRVDISPKVSSISHACYKGLEDLSEHRPVRTIKRVAFAYLLGHYIKDHNNQVVTYDLALDYKEANDYNITLTITGETFKESYRVCPYDEYEVLMYRDFLFDRLFSTNYKLTTYYRKWISLIADTRRTKPSKVFTYFEPYVKINQYWTLASLRNLHIHSMYYYDNINWQEIKSIFNISPKEFPPLLDSKIVLDRRRNSFRMSNT